MKSSPSLITQLEQSGIIPADELARRMQRCNADLYQVILSILADVPQKRETLGRLWADHLGVAYVPLDSTIIDHECVKKVPQDFARKHEAIPIYDVDGVITVVSSNPLDPDLEAKLLHRLNIMPSLVFGFPGEISDAIDIAYQDIESLSSLVKQLSITVEEHVSEKRLKELAGDNFVIELVRGLFLLAAGENATDIHIEPDEFYVRIRFRIDGALQERLRLEKKMLSPIVCRIKIMAGLDISEHRLPQDGRIVIELTSRRIDVRVSTVPTIYGEKTVLRLLGQQGTKGVPDLSELDYSASVLDCIKRVSRSPNGVFFVTGPTGSGKTTTLYSILQHINSPETNIMTIEDPVEYRLPGINQVQVNPATGLDFPLALRAFLRQDPNIILIGEIRDIQSARIASQAAMTGHLVLGTMHTNNALQAVNRLVEIGVEPFLVAPSLISVMAQRLVRRICPHCREAYPAPREMLNENFEWDGKKEVLLYRGAGCAHCHGTGYAGRIGIHEIFIITREIREMIAANASVLVIEQCAREAGFKPLRYDGLKKVLRGLTTIEEVERVTAGDLL